MFDKSNIAFICILGMITGFLVSTVALSISMFFFCVNALWGISPRRWLCNKWWLLGLGWMVIIAITYFWSDDKAYWGRSLQVKMPLLLYPLACGFMPAFSARQLQRVTLCMGLILMGGVVYSLSFLFRDFSGFLYGYRFSHLLPTPCSQDHVRFSMALALYFVWCIYMWPWFRIKAIKYGIVAILAVFVIYLHILAAKSGLVSLYVFVAAWSIYLCVARKQLAGLALLLAIPLAILLALNYIPTFKERKAYMYYAWKMQLNGDRTGTYGDLGRLMSYKLAKESISQHPWAGVGSGDMLAEMKRGYDKYYPQVEDKARLLPHNQFLIIALGCGIPAMLLFAAWVCYPLTWLRRNRKSFFFFMVWLLLLGQLLIEPILEVQFGVFVYFFFMCWQWQEMPEVDGVMSST